MSEADIEKKIALSLDELIAQQKAKQANKPKPKPKAKAAAAGGKKKGAQRVGGTGGDSREGQAVLQQRIDGMGAAGLKSCPLAAGAACDLLETPLAR